MGEDVCETGRGFVAGLALGAVPGVGGDTSSLGAGPTPGAASLVGAVFGVLLWFGSIGLRGPNARRWTTRWGVSGRTAAGAGAAPSLAGSAAAVRGEGGETGGAASGRVAAAGAGASVRCKGVGVGEEAVSLLVG
ncbi:hypothetical protein Sgleb_64200 [Streptomyces glebosus]|uniref:Uncharacterized protein n=1 Tax=Streptomyces glebosus TaxID=249580 RepID=A0A640T3J4_9ACTN|nr:hypothetical protein Sgleb_64200 [Streptomyces glebosus]GHG58356.1 hypothetical protein GCM10010513_22430 [Streptomyces glebosus]